MATIGIDLGIKNTAAAYAEGEEAEIINIDSQETMRSVVTFAPRVEGEQDEVIVGDPDYLKSDPDVTFAAVKRHMGTDQSETIEGEDLEYQPEMLTSFILRKIKEEAENSVPIVDEFDSAVITVPMWFSEAARTCTEAAAAYAYIDNTLLVPEPIAACVGHHIEDDGDAVKRVAVYNLGCWTFDLSIIKINPDSDGVTNYSVTKNGGSRKLGGENFDKRLAEYLIEEFEADTGVDVDELADSETAYRRVLEMAKEVKEKLSANEKYTANIPFLAPSEDLNVEVTRTKFEELTGDLVDETIEICEEVFDDLGYPPSNVDTVLTVGGSTKMPQVEDAVTEFFDQDPVGGVNPDKAVALGAGEIAKTLPSGSFDDESDDEISVVNVDAWAPDIGVELASGKFEVFIEDRTLLPTEVVGRGYALPVDEQESAIIRVFRGKEDVDSDIAEDHEHIKTFKLDNIQLAPKGEPDIAVRFEMDESGIVRAEAWDESIGRDSAADSVFELVPTGGGARDNDSPSNRYSPRTEDEIKSVRDDLPPVQVNRSSPTDSAGSSYSVNVKSTDADDSPTTGSPMNPEADDLYERLGVDPIASMADINKQITRFQVEHGRDYPEQRMELERTLKTPERRRKYNRKHGYPTNWTSIKDVTELHLNGPVIAKTDDQVTVTVTDENHAPLSGVDINVSGTDLGKTDELGRCSFSFDAPGERTVTARKPLGGDCWFQEDSLRIDVKEEPGG